METHRLGLTSWTGEAPRVRLRGLSHACLGPSPGRALWRVSAGSRAGCVVGKREQRIPQLWSPAAHRGGRGAPAWTPAPSPRWDGNHVLRRRAKEAGNQDGTWASDPRGRGPGRARPASGAPLWLHRCGFPVHPFLLEVTRAHWTLSMKHRFAWSHLWAGTLSWV